MLGAVVQHDAELTELRSESGQNAPIRVGDGQHRTHPQLPQSRELIPTQHSRHRRGIAAGHDRLQGVHSRKEQTGDVGGGLAEGVLGLVGATSGIALLGPAAGLRPALHVVARVMAGDELGPLEDADGMRPASDDDGPDSSRTQGLGHDFGQGIVTGQRPPGQS